MSQASAEREKGERRFMRKFSKIVLGMAGVLGIIGIGCSIAGVTMGAALSEVDLQQYYSGGHLKILDRWMDQGSVEYGQPESSGRSETDVPAETYTVDIPDELDIELACDELVFREYDGNKMKVEVTGDEDGNVRINADGGTLEIESRKKAEDRCIVISCPPDTEFQKVDIEMDAGSVSVENNLLIQDLHVSVGAGTFSNVSSVTAVKAEAEVGTGTLTLKGLDAQTIDAECGLGTMNIEVSGKEEDYSYRLSCGAGTVHLGAGEYSGVGAVKTIENTDAVRKMQLQCGMGTVNVSFEESL